MITRVILPQLPTDVPPCVYRGGAGGARCYCRHPDVGDGQMVSYDACRSCELYSTVGIPAQPKRETQCLYLGDILNQEPCSCGSASKVNLHACYGQQERHPGTPARCVTTLQDAQRIKDPDMRRWAEKHCCEGCPLKTLRSATTVAVVIPCHNYGRFLREAVESVLQQSHPAAEILIVDDSSTDETPQVLAELLAAHPQLKSRRIEAGAVFAARRIGYESTLSDVLCFLDADDRLGANYLAAGIKALDADWQLGIVYSDLTRFGAERGTTSFPDAITLAELERKNFIHAGSLVRRSALRLTEAFLEPPPNEHTHEDYWLWRRVLQGGWHAQKFPGTYLYRRHPDGSLLTGRREHSVYDRHGLSATAITIAIPLAGRWVEWRELSAWLDRQTWPHAQVRLLLGDTSQDPEFRMLLQEWIGRSDYPDVRLLSFSVGPKGLADESRAQRPLLVQDAVLRAWSRLARGLDTDWTLTLEDDVIPPDGAIEQLLRRVHPDVDAVLSPYLSRTGDHFVVWRGPRSVPTRGTGVERVDGGGFGCMLVRSQVLKTHVWTHGPTERDWYDPWLTRAHGLNVLCDWDCESRHLAAEAQAA